MQIDNDEVEALCESSPQSKNESLEENCLVGVSSQKNIYLQIPNWEGG